MPFSLSGIELSGCKSDMHKCLTDIFKLSGQCCRQAFILLWIDIVQGKDESNPPVLVSLILLNLYCPELFL
jgi:hypothetical protein